jgi:hypothetical protein
VHDFRECKINFLVYPSPWANLRLGASDSRLYYFPSNLTRKLLCAAARGMRIKANTGAPSGLHTVDSLAGSKTGMVTMLWIFLALTLGWVGSANWRRPVRNAINPASAGVSRLTAATRFEFLGFTSSFRMLSLSPRRKHVAALG